MAVQNEQKSVPKSSEQQGQSLQRGTSETGMSPSRRSYSPGFGITPREFLRSSPFSLMKRMSEEMDRVMQEFGLEREGAGQAGWSPAAEVSDADGKYSVRAELPGLSPNDVKLEVTNDSLIIQGERKSEHEQKEGGMHRTERQYGFFYRSFPLPEGADVEHAKATFQNGLLEITIPVPQQKEQRRSIPIEGESKSQTDEKRAA